MLGDPEMVDWKYQRAFSDFDIGGRHGCGFDLLGDLMLGFEYSRPKYT